MTTTSTTVELDLDECWRLISRSRRGRLAFNDSVGVFPVIIAIDYLVHDRALLFRSRSGTAPALPPRGAPVTVEIDATEDARRTDEGGPMGDTGLTGWTIVVSGHTEDPPTNDELALLDQQWPELWTSGAQNRYLRVDASRVSGVRTVPQSSNEFWWDPSEES